METKTKKINARNSEQVSRGNSYHISIKDIDVDFDKNVDEGGNPRTDYGTPEEQAAFKDDIRENGINEQVFLYVDPKTERWTLHHGYRRIKAAKELYSEEGVEVKVPFIEVSSNEEQRLIDHFRLNNHKNLSQLEKAENLKRLMAISQVTTIAKLATMVKLPYNEVFGLVDFIKGAGSPVKTKLRENKVSYDVAQKIVKSSDGDVTKQNELLEEGLKNAGGEKVRAKHIPQISGKDKLPLEVQLNLLLLQADSIENVDKVFVSRVKTLLKTLKTEGKEAAIGLLKVQTETV